jgi:hypothetical protein
VPIQVQQHLQLQRATTCAIPTGVSVSEITSTAANITWTAVSGAASYKVQYKTSAASAFTTVTSSTNSLSLTGFGSIYRLYLPSTNRLFKWFG